MTPIKCAYCGSQLVRTCVLDRWRVEAHHRFTRDHIMPKPWRVPMPASVRTTRLACEACNELRGILGHCPAMMSIARALADRFRFGSRMEAARRLLLPLKGL